MDILHYAKVAFTPTLRALSIDLPDLQLPRLPRLPRLPPQAKLTTALHNNIEPVHATQWSAMIT